MHPEGTASLTPQDTAGPPVTDRFAPICETTIFAALAAREARPPATAERGRPRFLPIRGEVALLAERVRQIGRLRA
jgi:hypothetical protein